jgi:hypothetical protein
MLVMIVRGTFWGILCLGNSGSAAQTQMVYSALPCKKCGNLWRMSAEPDSAISQFHFAKMPVKFVDRRQIKPIG